MMQIEAYLKVIEHPGLVSHYFASVRLPESISLLRLDLFQVCCVPVAVIKNYLKELKLGINNKNCTNL